MIETIICVIVGCAIYDFLKNSPKVWKWLREHGFGSNPGSGT